MTKSMMLAVGCIVTLLAALNAGFFYTWSFTIMQSLTLIDNVSAIRAMQTVNANIRGGWFGAIFFGAPLAMFCFTVGLLFKKAGQPALWFGLAFALLGATVAVTMMLHVPMNNALATVDADAAHAVGTFAAYAEPWTQWNHARTAFSGSAVLAALIGLITLGSPGSFRR